MTNKDYKRLSDTGIPTTTPEDVYNRLYELENAIENGTLVFLPCKVGDTVYYLNEFSRPRQIEEYVVDSVEQLRGGWTRCRVHSATEPMGTSFSLDAIGDYIFTTKEAAEKALEELK